MKKTMIGFLVAAGLGLMGCQQAGFTTTIRESIPTSHDESLGEAIPAFQDEAIPSFHDAPTGEAIPAFHDEAGNIEEDAAAAAKPLTVEVDPQTTVHAVPSIAPQTGTLDPITASNERATVSNSTPYTANDSSSPPIDASGVSAVQKKSGRYQ